SSKRDWSSDVCSSDLVEVLGKLPALMLPISSFVVTPVLGWAPWIPPVTDVEQDEVLHTLRVPVDSLLEPQMRSTIVHGDHTSPRSEERRVGKEWRPSL